MVNDPYQVLGVSPTADEDTIRQAYRRLAKKYHPDLNPGDATAAQRMNEINEAYDLIKNPQAYRQQQQQRAAQQQARQAYQQQQQQQTYYNPFDPFGFYSGQNTQDQQQQQSGQRQYTYYHYSNEDDGAQQQYQWNYRRTRRSPLGFVGKLVAVYFLFQIFFSLLSSCTSFWNPYSSYYYFGTPSGSDSSYSQELPTNESATGAAQTTPSYGSYSGFRR